MRTTILITCLLLAGIHIKAQQDTDIDSVLTDLYFSDAELFDLFDTNTNYHFLYFSTSVNTGTYFSGREFGNNYLNSTGQMYYFISNGLYFGASGAWYQNLDPSFRTTVVTLGFSGGFKNFNYFRYRLSYDRIIYLNMGPDFEPPYQNDFNTGFTLRYKNIGIRGDYTIMFGNDTEHLISADAFAKIQLAKFGKNNKVQLEPEVSTSFGNDLVEYDLNAGMDPADPFYEPNYIYKEEYGLLNTQLSLPLSTSVNNFDFEIAYTYNFPRSLDPNYYYPESGYWRFTISYIISIR